MVELTQEIVRELLDYNPETGQLTWRARRGKKFWNARLAGKPAFTSIDSGGYSQGTIFNRKYRAHSIAFLWMTGRFPQPAIDYIDRDRTNLKFHNLRESDHLGNARNMSRYSNNTSGHCGVHKRRGKFKARIANMHLGTFDTLGEAIAARKRAERKHGYAIGHGT